MTVTVVENDPLLTHDFRPNWYPGWSPRMWNGMRLGSYLGLLCEKRFAIHPARIPMATIIAGCSVLNSALSAAQSLALGRAIRKVVLETPPTFIIGHWRSGTTLLHELLTLDQQFAYANTYQSFGTNHFLISQFALQPLIHLLLPPKRPMDQMEMGVDKPQEDDFALCSLGAPSPYRHMAFSNRDDGEFEQLDAARMTPRQRERLEHAMDYLVRALTWQSGKPLVLKSPPHTGRIALLTRLFPGARFVHLSRHPYDLVPSTMKLWRSMDTVQGFHFPKYTNAELLEMVERNQAIMYEAYFRDRGGLGTDQLVEIQYEEFIKQPIEHLREIYRRFDLPDFDVARPAMENSLSQRGNYKKSKFELSDAMKQRIREHWKPYMQAFGYEPNTFQNTPHAHGETEDSISVGNQRSDGG